MRFLTLLVPFVLVFNAIHLHSMDSKLPPEMVAHTMSLCDANSIPEIKKDNFDPVEWDDKALAKRTLLPTHFNPHIPYLNIWKSWDWLPQIAQKSLLWPLTRFTTTPNYIKAQLNSKPKTKAKLFELDTNVHTDEVMFDSNWLNFGCLTHKLPNNKHALMFLALNDVIATQGEEGAVTNLTMFPSEPTAVYLKDIQTSAFSSAQYMVIAESDAKKVNVKVCAPTPAVFKKVAPRDFQSRYDHYALSKAGHIWKISKDSEDKMRFDKQKVLDSRGIERTYQQMAMSKSGLVAVVDHEGAVFIGDPLFEPKPLLMHIGTIPTGNIIRFAHTHKPDKKHIGNHMVYATYDKGIFNTSYPTIAIDYNYNNMVMNYWLIKNKLQAKR